MAYHFQTRVIPKRFELQQRDCAQVKALSKRIAKLTKFFELSLRKAVLWGIKGGQRLLRWVVASIYSTSQKVPFVFYGLSFLNGLSLKDGIALGL